MKTIIKISAIALFALLAAIGCKTTKKGSGYLKYDAQAKNTDLNINLKSPINSATETELGKPVYRNKTYFLVQDKINQFKDNAPFIQLLDGGKRERLWFTSSRADEIGYGKKTTNYYQQIYYSEREVGEGKCPTEGWGDPVLFIVDDKNPLLKEYPEAYRMFKARIDSFNFAPKGALTVAGNTIILSCDQLNAGIRREYKQLWSLNINGDKFESPKQITSLSNGKTWESQPALSSNGKHLFFVSNRKVNSNDFSYDNNISDNDLNIFYSFNKNGTWSTPILVKEIYSEKQEVTPQLSPGGDCLYFSSDRNGTYKIFMAPIHLNNESGGYTIDSKELKLFDRKLVDFCSEEQNDISLNNEFNQKYPFHYYNPSNRKVAQALFWASDNPEGMGSYDIYGCAMPFKVDYHVTLADVCFQGGNENIEYPVIEITGALKQKADSAHARFDLYTGLDYQVSGGSTACAEKGTYYCDRDEKYIFIGYSPVIDESDPENKKVHTKVISGPEIQSEQTAAFGKLPVFGMVCDTTINDTIFITKAWAQKPPCPEVLDIPQKYQKIPYFQTGFWEVNTSENLARDLKKMHEGFDVTPTNDIYNPQGEIKFIGTDYKAYDWESLIYPINVKDNHGYSIAHARWIELHPNNFYWGDRPDYRSQLEARMKGRKERIAQYVDYAKKVDENLKMLTDTIKQSYIRFLDLHKSAKPKLLIEIFAVSDQREILRGWYIGDTVAYRGSEYLGNDKFKTEQVKIVPPKVNETTKTVEEILPCSVDLNEQGNNGTKLGINIEKTDLNTNLSKLRAWFGYKEVYKRLIDSPDFLNYINEGRVALPDNNVSYDDADIIIITRGRKIDIIDPKEPYPSANNPNGQGFFDYDQIRRVEIRIRLLMDKKTEVVKDFCCYGSK